MSRSVIETSEFFARMEHFGFFDTVEEHLPDEFTLIFDIARILEDLEHPIARGIAPILTLNAPTDVERTTEHVLIPNVSEVKEYEADLIQSVTEVRHIYPYQFLLPEQVFMQRLAERSLWMPRPRSPKNFRYQTESDEFAPDDRKQKVYILFDTSSSMRQNYRIHLAKAIAYVFLQQNRRELGTIFFRTFDVNIGPLMTARDFSSYDHLISHIMHLNALGNGTAMQRALSTAIDDISHESQLSHAQILVITDGVAHIDLESLRTAMGSTITVNTVKIGDSRMVVDAKTIEDQIYQSASEDAVRLRQLFQQKRELESQFNSASGRMRQEQLRGQLGMIQRQIDHFTSRIGAYVSENYGLEIGKLSRVYINIDDINPREMFSFPEETVRDIEELAEALIDALRNEHQIEDIKRAALLYDHLILLMQYNKIDSERFKTKADQLESMLEHILDQPTAQADDMSISDLERMQLRHMLTGSMSSNRFSTARLLKMLWLKLLRWWRTRRQMRMFQAMTGRRVSRRTSRASTE